MARRAIVVWLSVCAAAIAGCGTMHPKGQAQVQATAAVVAGPGQTLSAAAVPWHLVGPGWVLAQDFAAPVNSARVPSGSMILYLVDPGGGRYRLFSWPAKGPAPYGELTDWSGDTQRALFASLPTEKHPRQRVEQLNLRTGKFTGFTLPGNSLALGYTRPDGKQILVEGKIDTSVTSKQTLVRYSLSGRPQTTLWRAPGLDTFVAYSPDGTDLVTDSYGSLALISNAGGLIRHLYSPALCGAVRWWNSTTILASCAVANSDASRMWLIPVSGAQGRALTPPRSGRGADQGDDNLYRLSSGTYLDALGRHCGNSIVVRQEPHGKVTAYSIPADGEATIVTATASRLLLQEDPGCSSPFPASLAWYNPVTGKQTVAVRVARKDAGVLAVIPYYQEGQR